MAEERVALAADFTVPTREQWLALVDGVLKGGPFARLVTSTYDGIDIQPLYTADDAPAPAGLPGQPPFVRGGRAGGATVTGWDVRARHADPDAGATNAAILADLERGATSIWLRVGDGGVALDQLDRALDGVYLDLAPVVLDAGADAGRATDALERLWAARGVAASAALAGLGHDPVGRGEPLDAAIAAAVRFAPTHPGVVAITVDGLAVHRAGASDTQEVAAVVAAGVEYLRALCGAGLAPEAALGQLEFRLAASADQFATIAKLRAARRLWARVAEVVGAAGPMRVHAVTSPVMMTRRDPWVNMLRTTVACFAAGLGGADAVTVLPFDHALGLPDGFARRIARNTQALLLDESNLGRVIDPAGGSWYVERLTEQLAEVAWAQFQAIEAAGGAATPAGRAVLTAAVGDTLAQRRRNLARRKDPITGVSEFPDIGETPVVRGGRPDDDGFRSAAVFEALRDRADAAAARPTVFLANLGPIAVHTARAGFAKNFFEVAGIATLGNDGSAEDAELVERFRASGCAHAVLCSSDKVYEARAESAAQALRAAGATRVYLAGNPGDARERYRAAGIDEFIYIGCDVAAVLTEALAQLGVR